MLTRIALLAMMVVGVVASPLHAGLADDKSHMAKKESATSLVESPKRGDGISLQTIFLVAAPAGLVILVALIRRLPVSRPQ